jgi:hypothetical protein
MVTRMIRELARKAGTSFDTIMLEIADLLSHRFPDQIQAQKGRQLVEGILGVR